MRSWVVAIGLSILSWFTTELLREASAQTSAKFYGLPHIGFQVTPPETAPFGLHYGAESGPTGGPYRYTEFFQGVTATEGYGNWAQRNNVWNLCFNLAECTGQRIIPDLYDFSFTFESAYQGDRSWPTLVENNFNMRYADGTFHRPWAFHVWTDQKAAVFNFSSLPGQVNFQINQNGNIVIGPPFRQPVKQLEVVGDALFTEDVEIEGALSIAGASVLTRSNDPSAGPLRWGIADGAAIDSVGAICTASGLECRSGLFPDGQEIACSDLLPVGSVAFALCR